MDFLSLAEALRWPHDHGNTCHFTVISSPTHSPRLFVGNVPRCYNEVYLLQLFGSCGTIVELVVQRDRNTRESRGSAFIWYATRAGAEAAIAQFNLSHALPDPMHEQERAMVVRRANVRKLLPPPVGTTPAIVSAIPMPPVPMQSVAVVQSPSSAWAPGYDMRGTAMPSATVSLPDVPIQVHPVVEQQVGLAYCTQITGLSRQLRRQTSPCLFCVTCCPMSALASCSSTSIPHCCMHMSCVGLTQWLSMSCRILCR